MTIERLFTEIYPEYIRQRNEDSTNDTIVCYEKMLDPMFEYFDRVGIDKSHARMWVIDGCIEVVETDDENQMQSHFRIYIDDILDYCFITAEQFDDEEFCSGLIPTVEMVSEIVSEKLPYKMVDLRLEYF